MEKFDCTYMMIKDTYYYGLFGDFKLVIDKKTGYFNATKLCKIENKKFNDWSRLERSKKLIKYYQKRCSHDVTYEIKEGNNNDITGTYVPKELILDIASWISVEFYDKCNNIIINYYIKEFKKMDAGKLQKKIKEVEDRAPLPEDKYKRERFVLLKRNDDCGYYSYYMILAQHDYIKRKLSFERKYFPWLEVLLDFQCNPNSKTLYTRIKKKLKANLVTFKGNNIELEGSNITEKELVQELRSINDSVQPRASSRSKSSSRNGT